jgi:hypothetical protein
MAAYRVRNRAGHSDACHHLRSDLAREINEIRPTQQVRLSLDPDEISIGHGKLAVPNPDSPGYLKLGARYYNPTTGRFTQPDPSGQEPNTYNYASCNPTNNTALQT